MPQQKSLFGNLPQLDQSIKEKNKAIVNKTSKKSSSPPKKRTATARSGSNKMANKIELIRQSATQMLNEDEHKDWYELIREEKRFREYMKHVREQGIAGIDTETNSLDPINGQVVGLCIYTPTERPMYVPINHTDVFGTKLPNQLSEDVIHEELELCERAKVKWVFHNAKFDIRFIKNHFGIKLKPYWDTLIGGNLLNENEPHGLKFLWDKYCNKGKSSLSNTFDKLFEGMGFNYVPIEIGYLYAAKDPWITFELYLFQSQFLDSSNPKCQKQKLEETANLFRKIEMPLISVLCDIEDRGVAIDVEYSNELSKKYNEKLEKVATRVYEFLNSLDYLSLDVSLREKLSNPLNIGSPQQLAIVIYDMLGMKSPDRLSPRGTGEPILSTFTDDPKYGTFFKDVLEYRGIIKLLGTYIDKLPKEIKEKTGRLHGSFNQYGAKTGRFSSSDPNLQNIPSKNKEIRKMIRASIDHVLIGADYSQQEPRVLAHLCWMLFNDKRMMNAYLEGKDLYAWMASEIYNVPYDECKEFRPDGSKNPEGKKRRDSVKSIILGLMYGRGTKAVAEQLGWTVEEAQRVVSLFFDSFPAIKMVIDYYLQQAREYGYIQTVFGRKRRIPDINLPLFEFKRNDQAIPTEESSYFYQKMNSAPFNQKRSIMKEIREQYGIKVIDNGGKIADAERQTLNSVIQGTSADITKMSLVALNENEELKSLGFHLLLTVHDENIGEAPEENAVRCGELMSQIMIDVCKEKISVPMKVDAEMTYCWYGEDISDKLKTS